MSINKFDKYRSVDEMYLNIPFKYILSYKGANSNAKYKVFSSEDAFKQLQKENPFLVKEWSDKFFDHDERSKDLKDMVNACINQIIEEVEGSHKDKTLCIVDFYGKNKALIAWRNNKTYKMGMTRLCKIIHKKHGRYILYRGKEIFIDDPSGWVIC